MDIENIKMGCRIREMREYQKLSREMLSEKANISTQFLADIESGKKGMSVQTLKKLCTALHITADSIIFDKNSEKTRPFHDMLASVPEEKQEAIEEIIQKIIQLL